MIVCGGGELPEIDRVASDVLGCAVRTYRPDTIGARDMSYVSCLGMMYYLNDRVKILGHVESSLVLPDISSTMSVRFKGLTKSKSQREDRTKKSLTQFVEKFFSDDDE